MDNSKVTDRAYQIGREQSAGNDIVLNYPTISQPHAEITCLSENTFIIQDKGSTNGTFVNQFKVKRAVCKRNDSIYLADVLFNLNVQFPLGMVDRELRKEFNIPEPPKVVNPEKTDPNDFTKEFAQLEMIYKSYIELRKSILGKNQLKAGLLRAAPGAGLGLLLALIFPAVGVPHLLANYGYTIGSSVGGMMGVVMSTKANDQEKITALNEEFKINYNCPKCKFHWGDVPWKNLAQRKICERCKAVWVK